MYFLIVLLLLFETDFTCSMRQRPTRHRHMENEMVPFDIPYTNSVKKFIEDGVSGYYDSLTFFPIFISNVLNTIHRPTPSYICDLEPNPSTPGTFRPTEASIQNCKRKCVNLNFEYLSYLETCTSIMIANIFPNETSRYKIKLFDLIHEIHGNCLKYEELQIFVCNCAGSYRILVSRYLKNVVENAVSMHEDSSYNRDIKSDFFTFILLLKYHPRAASLYLAHLAYKYKLHLKAPTIPGFNLESNVYLNRPTEVLLEDLTERSLIDNKGAILKNEDKIFQILLQDINCGSCDLNVFGFVYFNPSMPIAMILYISLIVCTILNYIFNMSKDEKLE